MSPGLLKVAERAKRDPHARLFSLAQLVDERALQRAYSRLRADAAVGIDGMTKERYGEQLEGNLHALHARLRAMQYRHQPIRRVHIAKAPGKTRPIGISSVEDKIVQGALTEVLAAIYEQDFLDCSFGFRPGRSAHDAVRAVDRMVMREGIAVILEADIQAFFDSVIRTKLMEMLQIRVADRSFLRLVSKCLHVGVLEGEEFSRPDEGTAQGSVISPMLGNVYLHYALDLWFEREIKPQLVGHARLIRFADDFVCGFERHEDAVRVLELLQQRMAEYGLTLHPDKTRLIPFERPPRGGINGSGPGTFDFLGFTMFWCLTRQGGWRLGLKTRKARIQRAITALRDWCRSHRHLSRKEQHASLTKRLRGHFQYFGVNGNFRSMHALLHYAERLWFKWLRRRSQRARRLTWKRFNTYIKVYPLPQPKIYVRIWARAP